MALVIQNKQGSIVQVAKIPAKIDKKSKSVTYNNGIYEIVYKKNA
jgi:HSP20 family molecular chaperone IbpA